jgi:hypothetical protein
MQAWGFSPHGCRQRTLVANGLGVSDRPLPAMSRCSEIRGRDFWDLAPCRVISAAFPKQCRRLSLAMISLVPTRFPGLYRLLAWSVLSEQVSDKS